MAFADISASGSIWLNNGLKYLLSPEDAPDGLGLIAVLKPVARKEAQRPPQRPAPAYVPRERPAPVEKQAPEAKPASAAKQKDAWRPVAIEEWPAEWREYLLKTKKGRIIWTYQDLGRDLAAGKGGRESDEEKSKRQMRGELLRKIIKDLALPPGSHTFWPVILPGMAETIKPEIFWSAANRLGARAVLIFGSGVAKHLLPGIELRVTVMKNKFGQFIWPLWDIDALAERPQNYEGMLKFLQGALYPFFKR